MAIPAWIMILTAMLAGGIVWFVYLIGVSSGRILVRLDALEASVPIAANVPGFKVGNRFEAYNVWHQIMYLDEYRVSDCQLERDDVIIDVGAHIGTFSYLCHTKGSRAIYCFEPSKRNFAWLERNVGLLPGVHLSRTAVWRSDGEQTAKVTLSGAAGENTGANSVLAGGRCIDHPRQRFVDSDGDRCQVAAIPLDEILKRFDRVKLLKMDCEGSEFPILLTSRELHRVERIVGEVHEIDQKLMALLDAGSRLDGYPAYRLEDLIGRLESVGFRVSSRSGKNHLFVFDASRVKA